MARFLRNKQIVVGVTGSIAAYKSADLVRRLRDAGAKVRVVMTSSACEFITPMTMQAVSGNPVHADLFDLEAEAAMGHIELAKWADLILIAPASADCMARLVSGKADDLLTAICLATTAPLAIAPAMNQAMWKHTATQANRQALLEKKVTLLGPAEGAQACGDTGYGRMLEPEKIVADVDGLFATGLLAGVRVLLTAGPTHEAIDPVRYIANGSSGKMGYALAEAAREAGADVKIISGPVNLAEPEHVEVQHVVTAEEMHAAVMQQVAEYDILMAVAAVADYRCESVSPVKLKKNADVMTLTLQRNPDIAASVGQLDNKPFMVGFAAETDHVLENARAKRERKNMDIIVANDVSDDQAIGSDRNQVTVISADNEIVLEMMPKDKLARQLIEIFALEFRKIMHDKQTSATNR